MSVLQHNTRSSEKDVLMSHAVYEQTKETCYTTWITEEDSRLFSKTFMFKKQDYTNLDGFTHPIFVYTRQPLNDETLFKK